MQTLIEQRNSLVNEPAGDYKLCPFCAEKIQVLAIKCRHCGEFLNKELGPKPAGKWYHSVPALVAALLTLGPLALPLVWKNPRLKPVSKAVITGATIVLTVLICWSIIRMYVLMLDQIKSFGM